MATTIKANLANQAYGQRSAQDQSGLASTGAVPHHHPRQSHRSSNSTQRTTTTSSSSGNGAVGMKDPYYGHEETAILCSKAIKHIFGCVEDHFVPQAGGNPTEKSISLAKFIAYAFHRTRLPTSVAYHALMLLTRLKMRYPNASCAHGHRLFLTSYMLSSKIICDDTYSNKSWAIVGQGFYELRDVNLMEREMISFLSWDLTIPAPDFNVFIEKIKANYSRPVSSKTGIVPVPEPKKELGHEFFGRSQIIVEEKRVVPLPPVEEPIPIIPAQKVQGPVHVLPSIHTHIPPPLVPAPQIQFYADPPPLYSPVDVDESSTSTSPTTSDSDSEPSSPLVITPIDSMPAVGLPKYQHHAGVAGGYPAIARQGQPGVVQVHEVDAASNGWAIRTQW